MSDNKLYKVAITLDGNYVHGKEYDKLVQVYYDPADGGDGCSYVSRKKNVNVRPGTDDTVWQKASDRGQQGQQGQTGATGESAGFGTPIASITGGVGTPSVEVTSSGPDTAKVFTFTFNNIKGETGETGQTGQTGPQGPAGVTSAIVTVDNSSGTPSATASVSNGVLSIAFSGLKGGQGDSGYSGASGELEVVNNDTSGGETSAWSAERGKQIRTDLTQLEAEVTPLDKETYKNEVINLSVYAYRRYSIQDDGDYNTNNAYKHRLIPAKPGQRYIVVANTEHESRVAFLTQDIIPTSGATAPLVSGTEVIHQTLGTTEVYTIPTGANFLYIYDGKDSDSYPYTPISVTLKENKTVSDIEVLSEATDVKRWNESDCYSGTGAKLVSSGFSSYSNYPFFVVPMKGGMRYKVEWTGATSSTNYAITTTYPYLDVSFSGFDSSSKNSDSLEFAPQADCFLLLSNLNGYTSLKAYAMNLGVGGVVNDMRGLLVQRSIVLEMERGTFTTGGDENNAYQYADIRQRSMLFLGVNPGDSIVSLELDEGETAVVHCYDSDFVHLAQLNLSTGFVYNTSWIRVRITNESGFATLRSRTLVLNHRGEVRFAKCTATTGGTNNYILFDVSIPADEGNTFANNIRTYDKGVVKLPYNYSRDGNPAPLILWCHGTGGFLFDSSGLAHGTLLQFFCKNGYAVADCTGITAYFGLSTSDHYVSGLEDSKNNPLLLACYGALLNYIGRKYNIDTTNVYVLAKSAGGLVATQLGYNANFRVRAIANLAPALCQVGQSFRVTSLTPMKFWLERFGIDTTGYDEMSRQERLALIESHISAFVGFDPMFEGTGIDFASAVHQMFTHDDVSGATNIGNAYANDDVLMAMFDSASKFQPVPMKIWHAPDDASVPILWSQKYVAMVGRNNGVCYLRQMPTGTGGHYSVDEGDNAPKTTYLCDNGDTVEITVAYAEALQWFRKW